MPPPPTPSSPLASPPLPLPPPSAISSRALPAPFDTTAIMTPLLSPDTAPSPLSPPLVTPPPLLYQPSSSIPHPAVAERRYSEDASFHSCLQRRTRGVFAGRITALLVDDNHINLQVLARILKIHMGDTIQHLEFAKNGVKALEMMHTNLYDIVLLDIDMPLLNGIDTARHIRGSDQYDILVQNRNIPIVAVTTNDSPDWKRSYVQAGMNGCISKPVVPSLLRKTLHQVLHFGCSPDSLAAAAPS